MSLASSTRCTMDVGSVTPVPTDMAVDTLGRHVAVAGENGLVAVLDLEAGGAIVATLQAHQCPVTRVAWAHHRHGTILATMTSEGELKVWTGDHKGDKLTLTQAACIPLEAGINAAAWAPHELGLIIAVACRDGRVTVLTPKSSTLTEWDQAAFTAYPHGSVYGLSWSPALAPGSIALMPLGIPQSGPNNAPGPVLSVPSPKLVTSGAERSVRIWRYLAQDRHWLQEQELADLPQDVSLVRDVAWANNPGLPYTNIAVATEEGLVGIWSQDGTDGKWRFSMIRKRWPCPVCRLGWSSAGTFLSVAAADHTTSLWTESPSGEWICVVQEDPASS